MLAIRAGFIAIDAKEEPKLVYTVPLVSGLIGLFTEQALNRQKAVFDALIGRDQPKEQQPAQPTGQTPAN